MKNFKEYIKNIENNIIKESANNTRVAIINKILNDAFVPWDENLHERPKTGYVLSNPDELWQLGVLADCLEKEGEFLASILIRIICENEEAAHTFFLAEILEDMTNKTKNVWSCIFVNGEHQVEAFIDQANIELSDCHNALNAIEELFKIGELSAHEMIELNFLRQEFIKKSRKIQR